MTTAVEPDVVERDELLTVEPALALAGLLGVTDESVADGAALPLLWHCVYLLDRAPQADLGVDGHPVRGVVPSPPALGLRRMFAGGRVRILAPLLWGEHAMRRTKVRRRTTKLGRSGELVFVTVGHEILQRGEVVLDEEQDLVYRPLATTATVPDPAPAVAHDKPEGEPFTVDPVVLFRFSALTYNAHRIHYDRDYAVGVEGYPGLVVHGPLQALAMAEAARRMRSTAPASRFTYRLTAPLFDTDGMVVRAEHDGDVVAVSVSDARGRQTAHGTVEWGSSAV